mgnify:CR=1 FL=1
MSGAVRIPWLGDAPESPFPPTHLALEHPNGLLAAGGDLSPERLLNAYRHGIFPWYSEGDPILWWSPAPRCLIYPEHVHLSRRTKRRFNTGRYRLTLNNAFERVIHECAESRAQNEGTWITNEMEAAYVQMHRMGHAHSLEVWLGDELAGGIYGLAIGSVFFGESMFSAQTDGSKIALVALCKLLATYGFLFLDCQVGNPHLYRMGAVDVARQTFEKKLHAGNAEPDRFSVDLAGEINFERW